MKKRKPQLVSVTPRQEQGDLFAADTRYVLFLSALITSQKAAQIGTVALAAFLCLRTHANFQTGRVSIGTRLIGKQIGVAAATASKAISVLEENGLIRRVDKGSKHERPVYEILDHIPLFHDEKPAGDIAFTFQPLHLSQRLNEAREVVRTGEVPPRSPITLNLTINIIQNNGGTVIVNETSKTTTTFDDLPPELRATFARMVPALAPRKNDG